jgi:CRISPR-associated protein Csm2
MRNVDLSTNRRNDRPNGSNNGGSFHQSDRLSKSDEFWSRLTPVFNSEWITEEATANLVLFAEKVGGFMAKNGLTNSKIRNVYGEIKRIQMGEFEKEKSSFYLLKPKVAYALGRDEKNEGLKLFKKLFDECFGYVTNQKSYLNFCNLMEAVLAYHKANGGKD